MVAGDFPVVSRSPSRDGAAVRKRETLLGEYTPSPACPGSPGSLRIVH